MKKNKIALIAFSIILIIITGYVSSIVNASANDYDGESILYLISPVGRSEYKDLGTVDLNGMKVNLVIFKTSVMSFNDTEKIYSDPKTMLPYRVERDISWFMKKEYITEEYDQKKFTVTTKKYSGARLINELVIKADGPIHNAILLPFYLRRCSGLKIGQHFIARFPDKFDLELVSIDEITVPAGKFQTYHFKSAPNKFEIWVSTDNPQVPVKIKGTTGLKYALLMKERR